MSCDVGKATGWRMSCNVGEARESLENEQISFSNLSVTSPKSQLILQLFRHCTYVTAHSPTLLLLHLHHSLFFNPSFASPTSQALHLRHLASRPWLEPQIYRGALINWATGTHHNSATNPSLFLSFFPRLSDTKHLYLLRAAQLHGNFTHLILC